MTLLEAPLGVLIVEDEALLAMDLEAMVQDLGHSVVAEASNLHDVQRLDERVSPAVAFVDVQLARGTSGLDVAKLILHRWPAALVIFITANPLKIPPDFAGAHGVIAKPFSQVGLVNAMRFIAESLIDPPPVSPHPTSFIASEAFSAKWARDTAR